MLTAAQQRCCSGLNQSAGVNAKFITAAEQHRWAASIAGCGSSLKIVGLCSGVSKQET